MTWCRQVTGHYLNQCWSSSISSYGATSSNKIGATPVFSAFIKTDAREIGWYYNTTTERRAMCMILGYSLVVNHVFNSSLPGQNGRHFADGTFKRIFMNEKLFMSIRLSLKFVPKGPIDNKAALVQAMAWRRTGDKPLPEPMLTHFTDAYMRH